MPRNYKQGIRRSSPLVNIVAPATGTALFPLPTGRTGRVTKVHIFNTDVADTIVSLGTGLAGAFAAAMAPWLVVAGMDLELREEDIPNHEFVANITAMATVAGAPIFIQVEVEMFPGTSA